MKKKVSQLEGEDLDKMVMLAEGAFNCADFSTRWADGGPIIEREGIAIIRNGDTWDAYVDGYNTHDGVESGVRDGESWDAKTPLLAAMRAYVKSKFGGEVEIP